MENANLIKIHIYVGILGYSCEKGDVMRSGVLVSVGQKGKSTLRSKAALG